MMANDGNALKSCRRAVMNVFISYYAILSSVLEESMVSSAHKAFAADLISLTVMIDKKFLVYIFF